MTYATIARNRRPPLRSDGIALLVLPAAIGLAAFVALSALLGGNGPPVRPAVPDLGDPVWVGDLEIPPGVGKALPSSPATSAYRLHDGARRAADLVAPENAGLIAHAAVLASHMRSPGAFDASTPTTGLIAHARALASRIRALEPREPNVPPAAAAAAIVADNGTARPTVPTAPGLASDVPMPPRRSVDTWFLRAWVGGEATRSRIASYDASTAVYEIASHTVYLPDGTRLEAHSGVGSRLDDPTSVKERMRGATPPNVYEIRPLDKLFHGVRALRLNPVGDGNMFGRDGMLAHTYMLGPRGESNGCVVFKNYAAFLAAWDRGAIKRLAVVARLD